jgi:hypothetical protein
MAQICSDFTTGEMAALCTRGYPDVSANVPLQNCIKAAAGALATAAGNVGLTHIPSVLQDLLGKTSS